MGVAQVRGRIVHRFGAIWTPPSPPQPQGSPSLADDAQHGTGTAYTDVTRRPPPPYLRQAHTSTGALYLDSGAPQPRRGHIVNLNHENTWTNGRKCLWRGHSVNQYRPLIPPGERRRQADTAPLPGSLRTLPLPGPARRHGMDAVQCGTDTHSPAGGGAAAAARLSRSGNNAVSHTDVHVVWAERQRQKCSTPGTALRHIRQF